MTRTQVKIIFAAAPHCNYSTSVSDAQTDEQIRAYFVNNSFMIGDKVGGEVCTDVVITRQSDSIDTGMDAATDALFRDLRSIHINTMIRGNELNYIAQKLAAKGWRK